MMENPQIYFNVTTSTGGAVVHYVSAPFKCTVRDLVVTAIADPGDADTVTVAKASTNVGVCTFGSSLTAPCNAGAYVPDSTNKNTVFDKGDMIKFTVTQCDAAVVLGLMLTLDPFCRTA